MLRERGRDRERGASRQGDLHSTLSGVSVRGREGGMERKREGDAESQQEQKNQRMRWQERRGAETKRRGGKMELILGRDLFPTPSIRPFPSCTFTHTPSSSQIPFLLLPAVLLLFPPSPIINHPLSGVSGGMQQPVVQPQSVAHKQARRRNNH